jgi:hypothetical protein
MVLGRFRDAVSDVAETIRRAFRDPVCHAVATPFAFPGTAMVKPLVALCRPLSYRFATSITAQDLAFPQVVRNEGMVFATRLCREDAWAAWAAGAKVCEMPIFQAGNCGRLAVPPLPRAVPARKLELPPFRVATRYVRETLASPAIRAIRPVFPDPRVARGLDAVLSLPMAIAGEDFQTLPRALNMRYTFQLVKATGENIRNLDVLGVFPVPVKGVASLRHDPRSGRILVNLNEQAVGAKRGRFILARKKDDRSYVSCFVED